MSTTAGPYRSRMPAGTDGFAQLLRAEWTKFRTVRRWVMATLSAVLLIVAVAALAGVGSHSMFDGHVGHPYVPTGPGGEAVADTFYWAHQPLRGNGTITVRVASLTGALGSSGGRCVPVDGGRHPRPGAPCASVPQPVAPPASTRVGIQPWAKAGVIVKAGATQGSPYAAVMETGSHGVRMQYDFTHDIAGSPGRVTTASPRWLRLVRGGDTLTGFQSSDGVHWSEIAAVHVAGLGGTVQVGVFVTSPTVTQVQTSVGGGSATTAVTVAAATFDRVTLVGGAAGGAWAAGPVGGGPNDAYGSAGGSLRRAAGTFTMRGSGDIAPAAIGGPGGIGTPVEHSLAGAFIGLIVLIVLATLFITAEYRRGMIRTTLAASPRRGRVLAAKAVVIAAVAFVVGVVGAAVALAVGGSLLRGNGNYVYPVSTFTVVRVVLGTGAVLALAAVVALAVGTALRRSAGAIAGLIAFIVLPYFLAVASVLPAGPSEWLLRLTPAAGFAVEQTLPQFTQVSTLYTPAYGYFPLSAWAGFAVLCAYAAVALAGATLLLRRRDV